MAVFLNQIRAKGYSVALLTGDRISVKPKPPASIGEWIRAHKPELLAELKTAPTAPSPPGNGVISYRLADGSKGTVIDPDGIQSAVGTLLQQYAERLDCLALIDTLRNMGEDAQQEASKLIARLSQTTQF